MNLGWIGTTPVKRLPAQGMSGQHLATPDGKVFTWASRTDASPPGQWVQVHPIIQSHPHHRYFRLPDGSLGFSRNR